MKQQEERKGAVQDVERQEREERGRKSDSGKTERRDTSGGGGVDSHSVSQSHVLHSDR